MKPPLYIKITIFLLGIVLLGFILVKAQVFIASMSLAIIISILLLPVTEKIEDQGIKKIWAAFFTVIGVAMLLLAIIYFISTELFEISNNLDQLTSDVNDLDKRIENIIINKLGIVPEKQNQLINDFINQFLQNSSQFLTTTISITASIISGLILIPFCVFFLLYYRSFIKKNLRQALPEPQQETWFSILHSIRYKISSYLSGLLIVILIIAVLDTGALLIIGIEYPFFWGSVAALLTIIPYVGVFIGSSLPIIFAFVTTDSLFYPLAIFLSFWLIQVLEGNLITPNIVGDKVELNPFVIILALFIGGAIWGPVGMVLAVPYIAILKVILENIRSLQPYSKFLGMPEYAVDDQKLFRKIKKKFKQNKP